jgi:hypothetical protein
MPGVLEDPDAEVRATCRLEEGVEFPSMAVFDRFFW